MDERLKILDEALRTYPSEPRLERLQGVVGEKRKLVNSIVGLARLYEQGGEFNEALGQWQILQIVYGEYPDLEAEIAHVKTLRDDADRSSATRHTPDRSVDTSQSTRDLLTNTADWTLYDNFPSPAVGEKDRETSPAGLSDAGYAPQPQLEVNSKQPRAREDRGQSLDESTNLYSETEAAPDVITLPKPDDRAGVVSGPYPEDAKISPWMPHAGPRVSQASQSYVSGDEQTTSADAPHKLIRPQVSTQTPIQGPDLSNAAPVGIAEGARERLDVREKSPGGPSLWKRYIGWVLAGISAIIIVILAINVRVHYPKHITPPVLQAPIEVRTSPEGAAVKVDAQDCGISPCKLTLTLGKHQVEATLNSYRSSSKTIDLSANSPNVVELGLEPIPPALIISTDLAAGTVSLDKQRIGELEQGRFSLEKLDPGSHTLKVEGVSGGAGLKVTVASGSVALINELTSEKNAGVWAISSFGGHAVAYSAVHGRLSVDGQPQGEVDTKGLEVRALAQGDHRCVLMMGTTQNKQPISMPAGPALVVFVNTDRNVGTLVVVTSEDGVTVLMDGKEVGLTQGGQFTKANLPVKQYLVEAKKAGFEVEPAKPVQLKKGEDTRVEFKVSLIPVTSALYLEDAAPGTQVYLDGDLIGTAPSSGTFDWPKVKPGHHTVEVRTSGYKPLTMPKEFVAGKTTPIRLVSSALIPLSGRLIVHVSPRTDNVVLRSDREPSARKIKPDEPTSLPPGTYSVTAQWESGDERTETVVVEADKDKPVSLALGPGGMENWENANTWAQEGQWFVHRGGGFVLYHKPPIAGRFEFTAQVRKGHHLQFVIGYVDPNNYVLYQLDEKSLRRTVVADGKHTVEAKEQFRMGKDRICTIRIEVQRNGLALQRYEGDKWVDIDTWSDASRNLGNGKFGLFIPADEIVALANFKFQLE